MKNVQNALINEKFLDKFDSQRQEPSSQRPKSMRGFRASRRNAAPKYVTLATAGLTSRASLLRSNPTSTERLPINLSGADDCNATADVKKKILNLGRNNESAVDVDEYG